MILIAVCSELKMERNLIAAIIEEIMNGLLLACEIKEFCHIKDFMTSAETFSIVCICNLYRDSSHIWADRCSTVFYVRDGIQKEEIRKQMVSALQEGDILRFAEIQISKVKYIMNGMLLERENFSIPVCRIYSVVYQKRQRKFKIRTADREYQCSGAIGVLGEKWKVLGFETSCRGILVNLDKVKKMNRYYVLLNDGSNIPLSQRRFKEFRMKMNEYCKKKNDR